jgi:hypothetical protein
VTFPAPGRPAPSSSKRPILHSPCTASSRCSCNPSRRPSRSCRSIRASRRAARMGDHRQTIAEPRTSRYVRLGLLAVGVGIVLASPVGARPPSIPRARRASTAWRLRPTYAIRPTGSPHRRAIKRCHCDAALSLHRVIVRRRPRDHHTGRREVRPPPSGSLRNVIADQVGCPSIAT